MSNTETKVAGIQVNILLHPYLWVGSMNVKQKDMKTNKLNKRNECEGVVVHHRSFSARRGGVGNYNVQSGEVGQIAVLKMGRTHIVNG